MTLNQIWHALGWPEVVQLCHPPYVYLVYACGVAWAVGSVLLLIDIVLDILKERR
jgi:hypothetical protein